MGDIKIISVFISSRQRLSMFVWARTFCLDRKSLVWAKAVDYPARKYVMFERLFVFFVFDWCYLQRELNVCQLTVSLDYSIVDGGGYLYGGTRKLPYFLNAIRKNCI